MKTMTEQKLIRKQVGRKLEALKGFRSHLQGISSWSKYIRMALGMSSSQLAKRLSIAPSSVSDAEKLEMEGKITLNTLRKMAEAMDCELVYAFVPKTSIEESVLRQARKKARAALKRVDSHMELEDQKVEATVEERLIELVESKMYSKNLWDPND